MAESWCSELLPGICPPYFPILCVGIILSPQPSPTLEGRWLQTEGPTAQHLPTSCSKNPRAHSHWMGLGHVPIPEPIPGQTGVRQAGGRGLCHRIPSEAGGDLERGVLPGEPQEL